MVVEFPKRRGNKTKESGLNLSWRGGECDNNALNRGKEMLNLSWRGGGESDNKINLGGIFRKNHNKEVQQTRRREPRPTKEQQRQQRLQKQLDTSTSSNLDHSRRFEDAVDWKNTSIDWGDDNGEADYEENQDNRTVDNDNDSNGQKKSFCPEKIRPRAGTRRRSSASRAADPQHEDSQTTAELTDSNCSLNASALGLSITSLL